MRERALLATKNNEDLHVITGLIQEGFDTYLFNGWHPKDSLEAELMETIYDISPCVIFLDDDMTENTVNCALEIHNDERTRPVYLVLLTKRSSEYPPYIEKFRQSEIGVISGPCGPTELSGHIKRMRQFQENP